MTFSEFIESLSSSSLLLLRDPLRDFGVRGSVSVVLTLLDLRLSLGMLKLK